MSTSPKSYFGWSNVLHNKRIRKLEPTSFKDLVANFFNVPHCVSVTRAEYQALVAAEDAAKEAAKIARESKDAGAIAAATASLKAAQDAKMSVKDCAFVTNCTFTGSVKQQEFADQLSLVCIDLDDPMLARQFDEAPEALAEMLYPHNFVAHRTIGWTVENPKLRIIVDLAMCPVALLPQFVTYVAKRIGLPAKWQGRTESLTLSQAMFKPVKFQGEEFNAVIISRVTGEHLEELDLPPDLMEEVERTYAYRRDEGLSDETDLDNLPIAGLTVEDIREPLFKIDPDIGREKWYSICAGLRFQFRDEESAEEAFNLWDDWSSGGDKYTGRESCLTTWDSFKPEREGRRPITIKSLFKQAMDAGWANTKVAAKLNLSLKEWIEACEDIDELLREGPRKIAALPFTTAAIEDQLFEQIVKRNARLKGHKVSATSLRKDANKARREAKAEAVSGNTPAWLRPWCYISSQDRFYSTITGNLLTPEAFNRTFGQQMMTEESLASGRPMVQPADFALNNEGMIVIADALVYDPRYGGDKQYFRIPGDDRLFVNEYRLNSLPRLDEKNSKNALKALKNLLRHLFRDEETELHMLDFMAYIIQFPGERINQLPLIQGAQGCGKTMLSQYLAAAAGLANCKVVGPNEIQAKFNDWAVGAQFIVIEEIWMPSRSKAEITNTLKPLVTNQKIAVSRKNKDAATMSNISCYMGLTNHPQPVYVEESDRRFWLVQSVLQTKAQVEALSASKIGKQAYFDYHGEKIEKRAGAIRHALLNYEIRSSFNPKGYPPKTQWREFLIHSSKNKMQREIENIMDDGHPLIGHDIVFQPSLDREILPQISRDNYGSDHYLAILGFTPWGGPAARFGLNGSGKGQVWVHADRYDECSGDPLEILMQRKNNIPEDSI